MIAKLSKKRRVENNNGAFVVVVTCPACDTSRPLAFSGWSAITCAGCAGVLYRSQAAERADNG